MSNPLKMKLSDELEALRSNPLSFFVLSADTLLSRHYSQILTPDWDNKPPLFTNQGKKASASIRTLKRTCRKSIPEALRAAIWLTNIVRISRPNQSLEETYEYGTLKKVEILDHGWEVVKKNVFPDESDEKAATIPDFGLEADKMRDILIVDHLSMPSNGNNNNNNIFDENDANSTSTDTTSINLSGLQLLTQLLYAARQQLNVEYCPLLPDLTALFLSFMHSSYAYAAIRELTTVSSYYLPTSKTEHYSYCKTFALLLKKMHPQVADMMKTCGALTPNGLDPIFRRFFVPVLRREHVLHLLDMYTIEGYKVIFRMGGAILSLCTHYMRPSDFVNVLTFWKGVRRIAHSKKFQFEVLVRQSYGFNGRRYKRRRSFPRRKFIERLMDHTLDWAGNYVSYLDRGDDDNLQISKRPLGFVERRDGVPFKLCKEATRRLSLSEFMPVTYKNTKVELIFSTDVHGRSLSQFYKYVGKARHTITLVEVLNTGAIIGMFATDTWHPSKEVYGDGECVLFRLDPNPVCYRWTHPDVGRIRKDNGEGSVCSTSTDEETTTSELNEGALFGEFMIGTNKFIAMGLNSQGGSGLKLNEDLTKGSSATARGFDNEPLAGERQKDFEVGLVEVYHLVREIDGKPVDGEEELWKGMFD